VLEFDPDRHERDVADDARAGLGEGIPTFGIGALARQALRRPGGDSL